MCPSCTGTKVLSTHPKFNADSVGHVRPGNSICNHLEGLNTLSCNWDGGDCCSSTCTNCDAKAYSKCLNPFTVDYEGCVDCSSNKCDSFVSPGSSWKGDGICDDGAAGGPNFNCKEHNFDNGDCSGCIDCDGNVCKGHENLVGDGVCDSIGSHFNFLCSKFAFEGGDCGECFDCRGNPCQSHEQWKGDGICDDGSSGIDYMCEEHSFDGGDCGTCIDCNNRNCGGRENWLGDGMCDRGLFGVDFDCQKFDYDKGDCGAYNCSATCVNGASCDTLMQTNSSLTCSILENEHGCDCSGCTQCR